MSRIVHTECACGVDIVAASTNEDDIRLAVALHNETDRHEEWRAVEVLKRPRGRGPCICRDGMVTNSPHTPQEGGARPTVPSGQPFGSSVIPRVKVELQ